MLRDSCSEQEQPVTQGRVVLSPSQGGGAAAGQQSPPVPSSHLRVRKAGLRSPCGPSSAGKGPESSQGAKMLLSCHPTSIPCRGLCSTRDTGLTSAILLSGAVPLGHEGPVRPTALAGAGPCRSLVTSGMPTALRTTF